MNERVISTAPIVPLEASHENYVQHLNDAEKYVEQSRVQVVRKSATVGSVLGASVATPAMRRGRKDARVKHLLAPDVKLQPVKPRVDDVRRNQPCLCGSGKKYKKCCGG